MTETTHDIRLEGCSPTPLAHYLKALGLLRLVGAQADERARGYWRNDAFVLRTQFDRRELIEFMLHDYVPTPIAAPWNGGSGIKADKLKSDWQQLLDGDADRFAPLRTVVERSRWLMEALDISGKVPKSRKEEFLTACRARWPDAALAWLDAALVLTSDGPKYPPILGTGGNDGRLDFSINFAARLQVLIDPETGSPRPEAADWLHASLFDRADSHLDSDGAIGQFFPRAAGGPNQGSGFETGTLLNPWDYVLMLEGAVMFASATVKRLGVTEAGALSAPFCARHVGVGHGSAAPSEEEDARPEMWLPLWEEPASATELHALMAEGRAEIDGRPARDGLDFARAVATLGVDRGISSFQRVGFQQRNGRAYFATPLNRVEVRRQSEADLLGEIDGWLETFLGRATADKAPGSVQTAARRLQGAIFDLCLRGGQHQVTDVLLALGNCERAMARSHAWSRQTFVPPLGGLSAAWLEAGYDGSAEYRLAAALASTHGRYAGAAGQGAQWVSLRPHLEPVRSFGADRAGWTDQVGPDVVWHPGDPVDVLNAIMKRRLLMAQRSESDGWPERSRLPVRLGDVAAFVDGRVDTRRMMALLWGLLPIDWSDVKTRPLQAPEGREHRMEESPDAFYALLKLCFSAPPPGHSGDPVPVVPKIHRLAAAEDGLRASRLAVRRLRASDLTPAVDRIPAQGERARRAAAALLFPVWSRDLKHLARFILEPEALVDEDEAPAPA